MPDETSERLELAAMIKGLRAQLAEAQAEGSGEDIRFTIEDVELELQVSAEQQAGGGVSAKFYVLTSNVKADKKNTVTQKLKLKLKVEQKTIDQAGKEKKVPLEINGEV